MELIERMRTVAKRGSYAETNNYDEIRQCLMEGAQEIERQQGVIAAGQAYIERQQAELAVAGKEVNRLILALAEEKSRAR